MLRTPVQRPTVRPPARDAALPGVLVALLAAGAAMAVHELTGAVSASVVAVAIGVALAGTGASDGRLRPGLAVAGRRLLRVGVVLLGFRLSVGEVAGIGPRALAATVAVVVVAFVGVRWLGRLLGVPAPVALLVATGSSICGASAIAAVRPISGADDDQTAYAVAVVTLCGTLAIGVLPAVGSLLGLSDATFGAWVGAGVHDVGQVVAAASVRGDGSVAEAVLVKLTRVAMLAPLLGVLALAARSRGRVTGEGRTPVVPLFVALFLLAVAVRSTGVIGSAALDGIRTVEGLVLGAGLVGLGSGVRLRRLATVGARPLVLGLAAWALIAVLSLAAVLAAGIR